MVLPLLCFIVLIFSLDLMKNLLARSHRLILAKTLAILTVEQLPHGIIKVNAKAPHSTAPNHG